MKREKGIRRTGTGWRAYGRVEGIFFSRCFGPTTTLTELKAYRGDERARIRRERRTGVAPNAPPTGSFRADAGTYLAAVTTMPTYKERKQHIEEWVVVFGDRPRASITSADVRAQLQRWRLEGRGASTVNHARGALMHLFTVLDQDATTRTVNPVRGVPRFRPPDPQPRGIPYAQVVAILKQARPYGLTKSYARLLVLAWTGLPPATLKRIRAMHLQPRRARVWVPGR
jgi:integrase